ncbi:uncharacterized protein LOC142783842 [Rhipicephalus microplus]|uniref:uncharacterized protein LOC142783842 n=1 Tax=Rhipicephalus microplus TaxID=6941 RepID=UPI003F6D4C99
MTESTASASAPGVPAAGDDAVTTSPSATTTFVLEPPRDPGTFSGSGDPDEVDVEDWLAEYERVLLTVFFVWPFRPTRIDPGQAFQASTGDDVLDIYNRGCDGINLRLSNSTFTRNTAKVTAAALWRTDINKPRSTLAFSGHGSSVRETMPKILLYAPQLPHTPGGRGGRLACHHIYHK